MTGTLLLMIVVPLCIPLTFALTPLVFAALLHLDEARGDGLRRSPR